MHDDAHDDDDYTQAAVLAELAKQHPSRLTLPELTLRMKGSLPQESEDASALGDTVRLAVFELERDGLVRVAGAEYALSHAAARMAELPDAQ